MTLAEWVEKRAGDSESDLLLQMDIEGAEYPTLIACPDATLRRFRVAVVEFHDLHMTTNKGWHDAVLVPVLRKLERIFTVVHIHANNLGGVDRRSGLDIPRTLEVTLLRKDRLSTAGCFEAPENLDSPNSADRAEIELSEFWYRQD